MQRLPLLRLALPGALCLILLLVAVPAVSASSLKVSRSTCSKISTFTPTSGVPGTSVVITGCGFSGASTVTFHGVAASFSVNSDTQITATVPATATTGVIAVTTPTRTVKSSAKFTVTKAPPAVTLSAVVGPPTSMIQVSGSGFGSSEAVDVYFDSTDEALVSASSQGAFSINIQVPASAIPGTHWITGVGRHSGRSAQASFLVRTDWAEFRDTLSHNGTNPYENVLSPANVANLNLSWTATTGDFIFSSLAVANGVVYIGSDDGNLYAFDAATGAKLWATPAGAILSSPAVANGVVYVGSHDGNLYAIDARTGAHLWSALAAAQVFSSPAVANGVVYVGSDSGGLYAFNAQTGDQLWANFIGQSVFSSPAVTGGVVYIGSDTGGLFAFNASTGVMLWTASTGAAILSSPAVANGVVYAVSEDSHLYAINAATGARLWSGLIGQFSDSSPAVANGMVYVGSADSHVYAFGLPSGQQVKPPARPNPANLHPNLKLKLHAQF